MPGDHRLLLPSLTDTDPLPRRRVRRTPAPAAGDDGVVHATLAERPLVVVAVLLAWCSIGLAVACVLSRRGHERRPLSALGIAFGPALMGFAVASLRQRERTATPVVLREAGVLGGGERVLVALRGRPTDVADALPVLRSIGDDLGTVWIGWAVSFEDAEDHEADTGTCPASARVLEQAALFLDDLRPGLLLLPGRYDDALHRYLAAGLVDVVIMVGEVPEHRAGGSGRRRTLTMVRDTHD